MSCFIFRKVIDLEQLNFSINEISRSPNGIGNDQYLNRKTFSSDPAFFFLYKEICMSRNFSWDMSNCFRDIKMFAFNVYFTCIRINFDCIFICFDLNLCFIGDDPYSILCIQYSLQGDELTFALTYTVFL